MAPLEAIFSAGGNPQSPHLTATPVRRAKIAARCRAAARAVWVLGVALAASSARAQPDEALEINREYAIKAAYLYNFGRYVEWPAESFKDGQAPFVIGILGPDPFGALLDEIASGKRVEGRRIVVRRFPSMSNYVPCHILFVPAAAGPDEKAAALAKTRGGSVLLVGDEPGFARQGAAIGFYLEANRVRFEINAEVAKRHRLRISSKLLSLGRIVGGE